jgi:hypothetical protein
MSFVSLADQYSKVMSFFEKLIDGAIPGVRATGNTAAMSANDRMKTVLKEWFKDLFTLPLPEVLRCIELLGKGTFLSEYHELLGLKAPEYEHEMDGTELKHRLNSWTSVMKNRATVLWWSIAVWLYETYAVSKDRPIDQPFMSYDQIYELLGYDPVNQIPRTSRAYVFDNQTMPKAAKDARAPCHDPSKFGDESFALLVHWHFLKKVLPNYQQTWEDVKANGFDCRIEIVNPSWKLPPSQEKVDKYSVERSNIHNSEGPAKLMCWFRVMVGARESAAASNYFQNFRNAVAAHAKSARSAAAGAVIAGSLAVNVTHHQLPYYVHELYKPIKSFAGAHNDPYQRDFNNLLVLGAWMTIPCHRTYSLCTAVDLHNAAWKYLQIVAAVIRHLGLALDKRDGTSRFENFKPLEMGKVPESALGEVVEEEDPEDEEDDEEEEENEEERERAKIVAVAVRMLKYTKIFSSFSTYQKNNVRSLALLVLKHLDTCDDTIARYFLSSFNMTYYNELLDLSAGDRNDAAFRYAFVGALFG